MVNGFPARALYFVQPEVKLIMIAKIERFNRKIYPNRICDHRPPVF